MTQWAEVRHLVQFGPASGRRLSRNPASAVAEALGPARPAEKWSGAVQVRPRPEGSSTRRSRAESRRNGHAPTARRAAARRAAAACHAS